jgi:hypothetical protein
VFFSEYQMTDKVQKSSNSNCNVPSREPFRIDKKHCVGVTVDDTTTMYIHRKPNRVIILTAIFSCSISETYILLSEIPVMLSKTFNTTVLEARLTPKGFQFAAEAST